MRRLRQLRLIIPRRRGSFHGRSLSLRSREVRALPRAFFSSWPLSGSPLPTCVFLRFGSGCVSFFKEIIAKTDAAVKAGCVLQADFDMKSIAGALPCSLSEGPRSRAGPVYPRISVPAPETVISDPASPAASPPKMSDSLSDTGRPCCSGIPDGACIRGKSMV